MFSRADANRIMAKALCNEMRAQRQTNEKLEALTGVKDRRIEALRSFTEECPVCLEDILNLGPALGPRFVTALISEIDMYAARFNGESPEKIAGEIIQLANKIAGGAE